MKLNSDALPVRLNRMLSTSEPEHEIIAATNIGDYFVKHSTHILSHSLPQQMTVRFLAALLLSLFHQSLFPGVITNKGNKCQYQQHKGRQHIPYIKNRLLYHF